MFKIIYKLFFFFKCLYSLYIFIFFKGLIGKKLTYYQPENSSNRNVSASNAEFELMNQTDNSIVIVSVKDKNKNETQILNENQLTERNVISKNLSNTYHTGITNTLPNDVSIVKFENTNTILEKSVFVSNVPLRNI